MGQNDLKPRRCNSQGKQEGKTGTLGPEAWLARTRGVVCQMGTECTHLEVDITAEMMMMCLMRCAIAVV